MRKKDVEHIIDEAMKDRERVLDEFVRSKPEISEVEVPQDVFDGLFDKIREYEDAQERKLTPEQEELIRLGVKYKKRRKLNRAIVIIAAVVGLLAFGITSVGGPKRVLEEFKRTIGGREQSYVNNDDERGMEIDTVEEAEAYEKIEDVFGVSPVTLFYISDGVEFSEITIEEETLRARMIFEGKKEEVFVYEMIFNYRASSVGSDYEDDNVEQYKEVVNGNDILIKKYVVNEEEMYRWSVEFEYKNTYYNLAISGVSEDEMKKIVENLYFF